MHWTRLMTSLLLDASPVPSGGIRGSGLPLNGHAYHCGDDVIVGMEEGGLVCQLQDERTTSYPCGSYTYAHNKLVAMTPSGPFAATELAIQDDLLISFRAEGMSCHICSLDLTQYTHDFLGFSCPSATWNNDTYDQVHYSFGLSGDVAVRTRTSDTISDFYGVWRQAEDQDFVLYFGSQSDLDTTLTIETSVTPEAMEIHGYSGFCYHDKQSSLSLSDLRDESIGYFSSSSTYRHHILKASFVAPLIWILM